ncbi:four helix bundle protein [bacterium]|nr:four helix bundle protein [candidate division CSSED10-310 bacterium]
MALGLKPHRQMKHVWPNSLGVSDLRSDLGGYRDLTAWQRGMELVRVIYRITDTAGTGMESAFSGELRQAALDVPTAIAQGQSAGGPAHFSYMLSRAKCALAAIDTQLILAAQMQIVPHEAKRRVDVLIVELHRLIETLEANLRS